MHQYTVKNKKPRWHFKKNVKRKFLLEYFYGIFIHRNVFLTKRHGVSWKCRPGLWKCHDGLSKLSCHFVQNRQFQWDKKKHKIFYSLTPGTGGLEIKHLSFSFHPESPNLDKLRSSTYSNQTWSGYTTGIDSTSLKVELLEFIQSQICFLLQVFYSLSGIEITDINAILVKKLT